ncbi:MAG: Na/Pi cotransporter family protein [Leptospiraceae bacterium]|nr:Na/Pi cotransporter family protein [Leptospiraceae bacterium]
MLELIANLLGGVGTFILGMVLLTESLKNLAGESLKDALKKLTGGKLASITSGFVVTATLQSSHATILTAIGFVSAGILSFEQSIGIILGANLGTTSTGWIVSFIGFKLSMGKIAFPLIGIGAMMKLLFKRKLGEIGLCLAGFSLLFMGIDFLQVSMKGFANVFNPSDIPTSSFINRVIIVFSGIGMTIVMQSSSAALATTLSALSEGAIHMDQACYLVIGQNIGTTLTAGIAAIGAGVPAKRTALIHIVFNVVTATIAFTIMTPLLWTLNYILSKFNLNDAVTETVIFHSVFNILGIIVFFPLIGWFSERITKLLPEEKGNPNRFLDPILYNSSSVALDAVERSLTELFKKSINLIELNFSRKLNYGETVEEAHKYKELLKNIINFSEKIPINDSSEKDKKIKNEILHSMDHMESLLNAIIEHREIHLSKDDLRANEMKEELLETIHRVSSDNTDGLIVSYLESKSKDLAEFRKKTRLEILNSTSKGKLKTGEAMKEIDIVRWFDKVHYYIWRISNHLAENKEEN